MSTAPGEGGIGIIRISGADAVAVADKVFRSKGRRSIASAESHSVLYGHIVEPMQGEIIDEVLAVIMRVPASYTREDVVEFHCHGGTAPLWKTMDLLVSLGVRQAEPGEFTKRAFLNGRIDLTQAEAVMDVIRSKTERSLHAANELLQGGLSKEISDIRQKLVGIMAEVEATIDFPEEDLESFDQEKKLEGIDQIQQRIRELLSDTIYGRAMREGIAVAIVGRPNVGKSSLLNLLVSKNRAIVTDVPGTTRDVLEEFVNLDGMMIKIIDTAGIRNAHDVVEQEGIQRTLAAIDGAEIVIVVLDGSEAMTEEDQRVLKALRSKKTIAAINKTDKERKLEKIAWPNGQVEMSCKSGEGLKELKSSIVNIIKSGMIVPKEHAWAVNLRHKSLLEQAQDQLEKARDSIKVGSSPEFIAIDLRDALDSIGAIIGATYTEDILERIFSDFCIGK